MKLRQDKILRHSDMTNLRQVADVCIIYLHKTVIYN